MFVGVMSAGSGHSARSMRAEAIVVDALAGGLDQFALLGRRGVAEQEVQLAAVLVGPSQVGAVVLDVRGETLFGWSFAPTPVKGPSTVVLPADGIRGGKRLNGCEQQAGPTGRKTRMCVFMFCATPFGEVHVRRLLADVGSEQDHAIRIPGRGVPEDVHAVAGGPGPLLDDVGAVEESVFVCCRRTCRCAVRSSLRCMPGVAARRRGRTVPSGRRPGRRRR